MPCAVPTRRLPPIVSVGKAVLAPAPAPSTDAVLLSKLLPALKFLRVYPRVTPNRSGIAAGFEPAPTTQIGAMLPLHIMRSMPRFVKPTLLYLLLGYWLLVGR